MTFYKKCPLARIKIQKKLSSRSSYKKPQPEQAVVFLKSYILTIHVLSHQRHFFGLNKLSAPDLINITTG